MSLDKLTISPSTTSPAEARAKHSLAWLLPAGLLLGFILVMAFLFGERLIPAIEVKTSPVITLRLGEELDHRKNSEAVEITKGDMVFQASGWVEPAPYITYVPTLINGIVDEVYVLSGDTIKKDQLLATLVDDDAQLNLQESNQKVVSLEARIEAHCTANDILAAQMLAIEQTIEAQKYQLADASDNYERLKNIPIGSISKQQLTQARLNQQQELAKLAEAEAEIPMIRAQLKQIEYQRLSMAAGLEELHTERDRNQLAYDRTKITAPMDGIVLRRHAAPGKKRMLDMDESTSAVIVEMYDPQLLQARIDVPLTEAAGLIQGQFVELVSDILPDVIFTGLVTSITGEADLQRNTIQCKVSIESPDDRLRPEMLLRAKFFDSGLISTSQSDSVTTSGATRLALYIPESALLSDSSVWVVSTDGKAELRDVSLSTEKRDNHLRVISGLKSGEQVIIPPHQDLKDGKKVKISPLKK